MDEQLDQLLRYFFFDLAQKHRENRRQTERLALDRLLDWSRHFLPHHFSVAPSKMHRWLSDRLDRARNERGMKLNLLAPRGAAKSTVATLAYPLRELLERREPYVWIISDTMTPVPWGTKTKDNPPGAYTPGSDFRIYRGSRILFRRFRLGGSGSRLENRRNRMQKPAPFNLPPLNEVAYGLFQRAGFVRWQRPSSGVPITRFRRQKQRLRPGP